MEVDAISQKPKAGPEQPESADLVIGILADLSSEEMASAYETLRTIPGTPKIVLLQNHSESKPPANGPDASQLPSSLSIVPLTLPSPNALTTPAENAIAAYSTIFATGEKLGASGCCVIASKLEDASPKWIGQLIEPILELGSDLITPSYALRKYEGLLNHGIISPLTRCLYGKRIQNPMGPDLGVSRRLFEEVLAADHNINAAGNGMYTLALLAPLACGGDFKVRQAYLGARIYPPVDWANLSSLLADVLGPVFLAMEKNAARWQRTRNSVPVEILDRRPSLLKQPAANLEISRLLNTFQLGERDLQEIWGLVLPPATLLELRKLSRLPPEQFRMPDELWARTIYDFALAHRLQTINRDHLLRSLTPLYLGWVASYAQEIESADAFAVSLRLERLAFAFEAHKPYLISRWRWPDRFNP